MGGARRRAPITARLGALAVVVVMACAVAGEAAASPAASATVARSVAVGSIDRTSKAAVKSAYLNTLVPALAVPTGWTGNTATCTVGKESIASRQATLTAVNFYRSLVGVGPVRLDSTWSARAMRAALMMDAADQLSHDPRNEWTGSGQWPCTTDAGAEAAGHSNLFWSSCCSGAYSVPQYILDQGATNAAVGHRRWLLSPDISRIGIGSTAQANAIWVVPPSWEPAPGPDWVAWPPPGHVPTPLLVGQNPSGPQSTLGRWSLSTRSTVGADFSRATVRATLDGTPLAVDIESRPDDASALVWSLRRSSGAAFPVTSDMTVKVTVSGIVVGGRTVTRAWTVRLFPAFPPISPTPVVPAPVGNVVAVSWDPAVTRGVEVTGYRVKLFRATNDPADNPFTGTPVASATVGPDRLATSLAVGTGGQWYWAVVVALSAAGESKPAVANLQSVLVP